MVMATSSRKYGLRAGPGLRFVLDSRGWWAVEGCTAESSRSNGWSVCPIARPGGVGGIGPKVPAAMGQRLHNLRSEPDGAR
jgi:hypothetical protein